ncbi:uncharacterized protein LOC135936016 [Cloeon dipterum]|uniref:uncharacterized protein LOC135936016 n=1 Tax=Cloeon dipterum TaxID=197152 RepID=UPI00321FABDE
MPRFSALIFVLGASLASATDGFATVFEWNKRDLNSPLKNNQYDVVDRKCIQKKFIPRYMAVFGDDVFLSLAPSKDASVSTLVRLRTRTSSTPPTINPFPPWGIHGKALSRIQEVRGLKVDSDGRLWALDQGRRDNCSPKLWIFNLTHYYAHPRVHQFPEEVVSHSYESRWLHDLELDQWNGDWLAYILDIRSKALVVFSLKQKKSWRVEVQGNGKPFYSIALSPKGNERQLYVGESRSKAINAISVAELRAASRKVQSKQVGNWSSKFCYKMLSDRDGFLYAECEANATIFKLDSRDFLQVERFYQEDELQVASRPYAFSVDNIGKFWLMATLTNGTKKITKLLVKWPTGSLGRTKGLSEPAPTHRNVTPIFEWDEFDFCTPKEGKETAVSSGCNDADEIKLKFLAVNGQKIFLSFSRDYPVTLIWMPAFSAPLKHLPYPSWQMQEEGDCRALQDVRGLQVDSLGRLWAVDNSMEEVCRPKLWIFDSSDQVELVYKFPGDVVPRNGYMWLGALALDETPDDIFAYITCSLSQIVIFSLKSRKSWRVNTLLNFIQSIALSPHLEERKQLYFSSQNFNELYSVLVEDLRTGVRFPPITFVGKKTAPSQTMAMDKNGRLYFDLVGKKSIATWDTNFPFKEEILFTDSNVEDFWPIHFIFDASNNLFLIARFTSNPRYRLFRAAVVFDTKCNNCTANKDSDFCRVNTGVCKNGNNSVELAPKPKNFTSVFQWNEFDFQAVRNDSLFELDKVQPHFLAMNGHRMFLSFSRNLKRRDPVTLAWMPKKNAFSARLKQLPYPYSIFMEEGDCSVLFEVRGLEVDSSGRLWAVDNGYKSCRQMLWIIDGSADKVELKYVFPEDVVRHGFGNFAEVALDETPDDFFAYIADSNSFSSHLVVFSLKARKSWRVEIQMKHIRGLAISPLKEKKHLYLSSGCSEVLYSVLVEDLRTGSPSPSVTFVGNKTAPSRRMAMDTNGRLYFDLFLKKSIGTWDTNFPFKEEILFTDSNVDDYGPFLIDTDASNNLFLIAQYASNPRYKLFKAAVEIDTKSSFCTECTAQKDLDFCRENTGICKNGGSCVSLGEQQPNYRCECGSNFSGRHCDVFFEEEYFVDRPSLVDNINEIIETTTDYAVTDIFEGE